jgi:ribonuclease P protein component
MPEFLTKKRDYNRVFKDGKRLSGKGYYINYLRVEGTQTRLGISVSKRIGNAVKRNLVKRRLRHIWREIYALLPSSYLIVLVSLPEIKSIPWLELKTDILSRLKIAL